MLRIACLFAIGIVVVSSAAVKLNPEAKKYVDAAKDAVNRDRVCKLIKIIASENAESKEVVQSLAPIKPKAYVCFANNGNRFYSQFVHKQIDKNEVVAKIMQACSQFVTQIAHFQQAATKLASSAVGVIEKIYTELPESAKKTVQLMKEMNHQPGQQVDKQKEAEQIRAITASIRAYSDADRQQIAKVIPSTANFILKDSPRHAEFNQQLDLIDKHADGTITEEEKQQMAEQSFRMNHEMREHFIEDLEMVSKQIDNAQVPSDIDNDQKIKQVCNSLGQVLVNQFKRRINTPAFKNKINEAIKNSNKMEAAITTA